MALDLVTGYQGKNHVTAEQWADFNRGVYGDAAILPIGNRMQVEIQTANQITVKDGTGVFDGRQVYIGYGESENIAIESGTQEMLRNDIVVIEYTKDESTGVESAAFKVIAGTPAASDPADPSYQDMDIRTGVFVSQKPFCRVRLNGVAIEGVDMLVEVKEFAAHAFQPPAANLTTTEPGQALDATMGKQLKEGFDQLTSRFVGISKVAGVTSTGERQNTGVTVDIPAGAFFCFTAIAVFNNSSALWVGISENDNVNACHANANSGLNNASCTLSGVNNTDDNISYHIFAQWSGQANNEIRISGFYVRKS